MLQIDAKNVLKYRCIHCLEWIPSEDYTSHQMVHYKETTLPTPNSLQEMINRFSVIGLVDASDFELR